MACVRRWLLFILVAVGFLPASLHAASNDPPDFKPDPKSVQREGKGYRYPQAGWIVVHIEGEPYERGYQHGKLLAPEIAANVNCFATVLSPKAPEDSWKLARTMINALFLRRYDREYLEEMKGIADGAAAAGAKFLSRPVDLIDIVALNAWMEFDTLDSALDATPTGLEGTRFPKEVARASVPPKPEHCSAFAATGPATADGKIVFGHITMFRLYPSNFYNVWLDVKPAKGYRVMMQTYPGGIQSGMDYYLNETGLLVSETTIRQTRFDVTGQALASRIRQTLQYADNIDRAVEILKEGTNGLYTNEWLLGDTKTNEIAMFELGTHKTKLYRSSKNEWFGGTEGFYWGCNNTKDLDVRLETIASTDDRPANMVFRPAPRDRIWMELYAKHKGKIDVGFGKEAFTTPIIAAHSSLDAKFTTSALAKEMKSWALFGPPLGRSWQPSFEERERYPAVRPLVSNPWTILHGAPPDKQPEPAVVAVDLNGEEHVASKKQNSSRRRKPKETDGPVWHGTLLPRTDADIWLAAAFADYEPIVAQLMKSHAGGEEDENGEHSDSGHLALAGHRSSYLSAVRILAERSDPQASERPLARTESEFRHDEWYRVAAGKGVLLLHQLRSELGDKVFAEMMESFGRKFAGKEVSTADFVAHASKAAGLPLDAFFQPWLEETGLVALELSNVTSVAKDKGFVVEGTIQRRGPGGRITLQVAVETKGDDVSQSVTLEGSSTHFRIESPRQPERVVLDPHGDTPKANGGVYSVTTYESELDHCLIVYGTDAEAASNREAAENLQRGIVEHRSNFTVPIKSDRDVTESDLSHHHLLLIGRPDSNSVVARVREALPISFGSRSFVVGRDSYAHANSAVIAVGDNPLNRRYSALVIAGLSAASTIDAVGHLLDSGGSPAEVLILANGSNARPLVLPAKELIKELK